MTDEKRDDALPDEELDDIEDFVEIHSFGIMLNALSLKAALNSLGIDVMLRKMATPMFPAPYDAIRLAVRVSDVEKARKVIDEIMGDESKAIDGNENEGEEETPPEE